MHQRGDRCEKRNTKGVEEMGEGLDKAELFDKHKEGTGEIEKSVHLDGRARLEVGV